MSESSSQETVVIKLGIKLRTINAEREELYDKWEHESDLCPHHSDTVGDCDHEDNESSNMCTCQLDDCPLLK